MALGAVPSLRNPVCRYCGGPVCLRGFHPLPGAQAGVYSGFPGCPWKSWPQVMGHSSPRAHRGIFHPPPFGASLNLDALRLDSSPALPKTLLFAAQMWFSLSAERSYPPTPRPSCPWAGLELCNRRAGVAAPSLKPRLRAGGGDPAPSELFPIDFPAGGCSAIFSFSLFLFFFLLGG